MIDREGREPGRDRSRKSTSSARDERRIRLERCGAG